MKHAVFVILTGTLALASCGGASGDSSDGGDSKSPVSGDHVVLTVDGGAFDGITKVAVANCDLETPGINVATVQDADSGFSLFAMSDPQGDGTASFQLVKSKEVFFDNSKTLDYTISGKRLTGSGGELSGDPGKVSVEVICD